MSHLFLALTFGFTLSMSALADPPSWNTHAKPHRHGGDSGQEQTTHSVPEPASLLLIGAAAGAAGIVRFVKRRR